MTGQTSTPQERLALLLEWTAAGLLAATLAMTALGAYGRTMWTELFSHFRVQYLVMAALCLGAFLIRRHPIGILAALAAVLWNLAAVGPYYRPTSIDVPQSAPRLKILQANVHLDTVDFSPLLRLIETENPDLIALEEVTQNAVNALLPLKARYPHQVLRPSPFAFGMALYSRIPLEKGEVIYLPTPEDVPIIRADFRLAGEAVTVLVMHPYPPPDARNDRDRQLVAVAGERAQYQRHLIVVGDLNITPWSPAFPEFLKTAGLQDSQKGFGVQPSWPASDPLYRIPIDHVLTSPAFTILERKVGPNTGSDHFPVVVEAALTPTGLTK